ncbi:MAG: glycosyltransferase [Gammaproteobacteria bacterium]|nr:glycosyltransferase [Gammaproteobacteria bacterium]
MFFPRFRFIYSLFFRLFLWAMFIKPDIFHCRSFFPAVLGFSLAKIMRKKILFDIRGFAMEEKIDSGRLSRESLLFRVLDKVEHCLYRQSDYVVVLTLKAKEILCKDFQVSSQNISVIPTCASRKRFFPADIVEKSRLRGKYNVDLSEKVLIHVGCTGRWYDLDSEIKLFSGLYHLGSMNRFVILTKDDEKYIHRLFQQYNVPQTAYLVTEATFASVREWLVLSDFCIFFAKSSRATQAGSPTKFAEMIAAHLPVIANAGGVGDVDYFLSDGSLGCLVDLSTIQRGRKESISVVNDFIKIFSLNPDKFDTTFNDYFSKEKGIEEYTKIYHALGVV